MRSPRFSVSLFSLVALALFWTFTFTGCGGGSNLNNTPQVNPTPGTPSPGGTGTNGSGTTSGGSTTGGTTTAGTTTSGSTTGGTTTGGSSGGSGSTGSGTGGSTGGGSGSGTGGNTGGSGSSAQITFESSKIPLGFPNQHSVADFNNDGIPDIAYSQAENLGTGVAILQGNGDGSFTMRPEVLAGQAAPLIIATADLNHDGNLDLVMARNARDLNGTISVAFGHGDGTFSPAQDVQQFQQPVDRAVTLLTGDFNGDGNIDIAYNIDGGAAVILNEGNGTFSAPIVSRGVYADAAVDLNGDGKLDLAGMNKGVAAVVSLGNGDGTFGVASSLPTGLSAATARLTVADFNGDGINDIAVGTHKSQEPTPAPTSSVQVWLGKGDGTYRAAPTVTFDGTFHDLTSGDFNGDGKVDLAVVIWGRLSVFPGKGDGTFDSGIDFHYSGDEGGWFVHSADFNRDGKPDLAISTFDSSLTIMINTSK